MDEEQTFVTDQAQKIQLTDKLPFISVGIPTYNGGGKIQRVINSLLDQKYPNLEIIISDNCSTDNTMEVCREMQAGNPAIRYFRQPSNIGVMPNFEFVRSKASGDFFMWISDDDFLEPGILAKYVDFLAKHHDYALVSGKIKHWAGDKALFCEAGFNFEQNSAGLRLLNFYFKVVYGAIFYGMMPLHIARMIPLTNRMGDDWHFVASVAFLGKIKNFDCVGYHKKSGGISRSFQHYARIMKAPKFSERFPHIQIALNAFDNILRESPVYKNQNTIKKIILALSAFLAILISFYGKQYPFILGGRIKRLMHISPVVSGVSKSSLKRG